MNSIDTLVTFGDSWPYGSGLTPEQKPFGKILAELLNIENFKNCAIPATSNSRTVWELNQYIESTKPLDKIMAIFFITSPGRSLMVRNDKKLVDINMTHKRWTDLVNPQTLNEIYYKYFHTKAKEEFDLKKRYISIAKDLRTATNTRFLRNWLV